MGNVTAFRNFLVVVSIPLAASTLAAAGFAPGDYDGGGATLHFAADGTYRVAQGAEAMVEGTYRVDGEKIVLTDVSGAFACKPAEKATGTYAWHLDGDALKLSKIDDACDDRSTDLTAAAWKKKPQ